MKILRISVLLLLILSVIIVSGCKLGKNLSDQQPGTMLGEGATPSEQAVDSGLQELDEIDSLTEETDLGLEELEKIQLE